VRGSAVHNPTITLYITELSPITFFFGCLSWPYLG